MEKEKSRHSIRNRVIFGIFLIVFFILTSNFWLAIPGRFLLVEDNISKADCIVTLRGNLYLRFKKTIELRNEGYSKNIVTSVLPEEIKDSRTHESVFLRIYGIEEATKKEFTLMAIEYFGGDRQGVFFTEREVTSTYDEAIETKKLMFKKEFKSLILVTSGYHMRRALLIFKYVFRGSGINIYNCSAGKELNNPSRWWHREGEVKGVFHEHLSMGHNFIYYFLLKKGRTSFDSP